MSEIVPSQIVAVGSVSSIHIFDSNHVIKRSPPSSDKFARRAFDIKVRAYERLGNYRRIAVLSDVTSEGIIIQRPESGKITMCTRLRWAQEASEGLCCIHSKGIIHADCASRGDSTTTKKTDIFAFEPTLFEIEFGHVPYHELCETMEIIHAIPNMENLFFRHVITKCWDGTYSCMFERVPDLRSLELVDDDDNQCPAWEIVS
ncbi:uncharacterized protein BO96DRAFT_470839 [Aspergillus niger CBS 101883]|uniref:uncharacterized protein n=1 Tax=Aspergillus lacticoffeatus (strain CBS 101883) TaxID=1450533 RepID=UPI000D803ECC|nr:uncharacterized protein BO96DRAFT_470839 [Aspergillus niger CBS 101883]PYH50343.1 hypothetical protein BO96DRAFT_470839 [Aspergillus niger CBS 101883]